MMMIMMFVFLFKEGLRTFNTPKYRQFAKRLGRLIRHTVHYVSDHWENFKTANWDTIDTAMALRLQVRRDGGNKWGHTGIFLGGFFSFCVCIFSFLLALIKTSKKVL